MLKYGGEKLEAFKDPLVGIYPSFAGCGEGNPNEIQQGEDMGEVERRSLMGKVNKKDAGEAFR